MPDWAMTLLVTAGGLAMMGGGAKAWWSAWREDRKAKADAAAGEKRSLESRVERLQDKLESLLRDAVAQAKDDKAERAERLAMDAKLFDLLSTISAALKEAATIKAKLERGET